MRTIEAFRVAVGALLANRLRSLLTMLGVIIGVAAVVLLVAIGAGAQQEVESQVEGLGSNLILVVPGQLQAQGAPTASRLNLDDQRLLASVVGDDRAVTSNLASGELVRAGTRTSFSTVQGNDQNLPRVFDRPLRLGSSSPAATSTPAAGSR